MNDIRYTFPIVYHKNKIYAIGGRVYGSDRISLLKKCEVFDYETYRWTKLPDMNLNRCTASAFVYGDSIWVIGGYTG